MKKTENGDKEESSVVKSFLKLRLIGSSMGGYLAARYAELFPEEVDRMILLCPGFNLHERWPHLFGNEELEKWMTDKGKITTTIEEAAQSCGRVAGFYLGDR